MHGLNAIHHLNQATTANAQATRLRNRIVNEHGRGLDEHQLEAVVDQLAPIILGETEVEGVRGLVRATYGQ
jgi:hypothetical protein